MNKYTILLLLCMSIMALTVSACGVKYARPDRCVCGICEENDADKESSQTAQEQSQEEDAQNKKEEFKQAFTEQSKEEEKPVFTIDFEKLSKQELFEFNSANIAEDNYDNLNMVVEYMKENPKTTVRVEGHTDEVGTSEYNQTLSEKRASAVADYFVEKGIERERVSSVGYGKTKPKYDNSTEEGRARNRRVELVFTK